MNNNKESSQKRQIKAYIDGFNLYHSIVSHGNRDYKWINVRELVNLFVNKKSEELGQVDFFSAYPKHLGEDKVNRHKIFEQVQKHVGKINFVNGNFKRKEIDCKSCKKTIHKFEEKKTDIALGIQVITDLLLDENLNKVILVTNDGDFAPVIDKIKELQSSISKTDFEIKLIIPPHKNVQDNDYPIAKELIFSMKNYYDIEIKNYLNRKCKYHGVKEEAFLFKKSKIRRMEAKHLELVPLSENQYVIDDITYNNPYNIENIDKNEQ